MDVDSTTPADPAAAPRGWETTVNDDEVARVNAGPQPGPGTRFLRRVLLIVGPLGLVLAIAAVFNPWRLVVLYPVGVPLLSSVLLALAWTGTVFGLRSGNRPVASVFTIGVSLLVSAAVVLNVVTRLPVAGGVLGSTHLGLGEVVAVSPDNRFEVVWYDDGPLAANALGFGSATIVKNNPEKARVRLVLRVRDGVLTHDGPSVIGACEGEASKEQVAVFTGPTAVAVRGIGATTTITFDPNTLVASGVAQLC